MFKKIIISIFLLIISFLFVYLLADRIVLPYFLYTKEIQVPKTINYNIATAKALLNKEKFDFNIQYVPSYKKDSIGMVIYSNPEFGKIVKKGTMIDLKVLGLEESYPIPDLKFKSKSVALNILKSMGMSIDTIIYDYWDVICTSPTEVNNNNFSEIMDNCNKYDKNIIWNQIPSSSENFYKNDSIILFVSKGSYAPEFYEVPILIDLNLEQAINAINQSGLILGDVILEDYLLPGEASKIDVNLSDIWNKLDSFFLNINFYKYKVIDQSQYGKCRIHDKINLVIQE